MDIHTGSQSRTRVNQSINQSLSRLLVLAVILSLFVGFGAATTLHVDDDFDETNEAHYPKIQEAVDAADSGDTIEVAAGTYKPDNLVVDKSDLTLQFQSGAVVSQSTAIDDSLFGFISIEAENVVMKSVHESEEDPAKLEYTAGDYYPAVEITGTGTKLEGFDIIRNSGNDEAVAVRASDVVVRENKITGDAAEGVMVSNPWNSDVSWNPDRSDDNTANVTIKDNTVDGLKIGMVVRSRRDEVDDGGTTKEEYQGSVKDITLDENTVKNNGNVGILAATESDRSLNVETPQDVTISGNEIKSNPIGIEFDSIEGAEGFDTGQVTVENNLITGSKTMTGIQINATDVTDNGEGLKVIGNEFTNQGDNSTGENLALHIHADNVTGVEFRENSVTGYMRGVDADKENVDNLKVIDNDFNIPLIEKAEDEEASGLGVQLWHGNNLQVEDNTFTGSIDEGTESAYTSPDANYNHYAVVSFTTAFMKQHYDDEGDPTWGGWSEIDGDVHIKNNEMSNLYLGVSGFARTGEIRGNNIHDNYIGIQVGQVDDVYATAPSKGLAIVENDIVNNTRGIWVQNFVEDGMHASNNRIVGNSEAGIKNEDNNTFLAYLNYWGSNRGPTVQLPNGNWIGDGDKVIGEVHYKPFLTDSPDNIPEKREEIQEFAFDALIRGNGEPYTIGFPGEVKGTVSDVFNDFEGEVWEYDADNSDWSSVDKSDSIGALDAYVLVPSENETVRAVIDFADSSDQMIPGEKDVSSGWNFIAAPENNDAESAFGASSASPARVLGLYNTPKIAESQGTMSYTFGDNKPPTVNPLSGYWVYTEKDGTVAANIGPGMTFSHLDLISGS